MPKRIPILLALTLAACMPQEPSVQSAPHLVRFVPGGGIELDGVPVTPDELEKRVKAFSQMSPQPVVQLHPETAEKYPHLAPVMNRAFADGVVKIGVIGGSVE